MELNMKYPMLWLWLNVRALSLHMTGEGDNWSRLDDYNYMAWKQISKCHDPVGRAEDLYNAAKHYIERHQASDTIPSRAFIHGVMLRCEDVLVVHVEM